MKDKESWNVGKYRLKKKKYTWGLKIRFNLCFLMVFLYCYCTSPMRVSSILLFLNCFSQLSSLLLHIYRFSLFCLSFHSLLSLFFSLADNHVGFALTAQPIQHCCYPAPSTGITAACAPKPCIVLEKRWRPQKPAWPPMTASFQRL